MRSGLLTFCIAAFLAFFSFSAHAKDNIVGVIFYADWCGSCKILDPRINEARKDPSLEDTKFVLFDMTDGQTIENTKKKAEAENLTPLLNEYGAVTGFMVIYDREKQEKIDVITTRNTSPEIIKAFSTAAKKD